MAVRQAFLRPFPTTFAAVLLGLTGLSLAGCMLRGSGTQMTDEREVDAFESIEIGGAFELVVHVEPGVTPRVSVSGDDNIVPEISTTVADGELDIELDGMVRPKLGMKVEVWVASLAGIEASGATDITVEGLHGERFELELSGASQSHLSGTVDHFEVHSSGASDLEARELHAKTVEVKLSGAGDAEVWASDRLDADVSGAGNVRYFGDTKDVHQDVSGVGEVNAGT
jgi:hypothetical protein